MSPPYAASQEQVVRLLGDLTPLPIQFITKTLYIIIWEEGGGYDDDSEVFQMGEGGVVLIILLFNLWGMVLLCTLN